MIGLLLQAYRRRHTLSRVGRKRLSSSTMDTFGSIEPDVAAGAAVTVMSEGIRYLNPETSPLNMSKDEEFQRLTILSITGPHSYFIFEIFDMYDVIQAGSLYLTDEYTYD